MDKFLFHSTKRTEKQAIQMRDMECMSVTNPMPPRARSLLMTASTTGTADRTVEYRVLI